MNKTWKTSWVILLILFIIFSSLIGEYIGKKSIDNYYSGKKNIAINEALLETANQINSKLPLMIDSETQLNTTIGINKTFRYNYTLVNHPASDLSADILEHNLKQKITNSVCTSKEMEIFMKNGVTIEYAYFGNDGKQISVISISPSNCTGL
jgi:hypothetical protein